MGKLTKNQKLAAEKIEAGKAYSLKEASELVKEITFTKFDASLDIDVRLGVDPRKANQMVRGVVSLPHGTGKKVTRACSHCHGKGYEHRRVKLDIKIPAGIQSGQQIRIPGKGERGTNGGPNGDLYIEIMVTPHPTFKREDNNIFIKVPISSIDATIGCTIQVPTVYGDVELKIPEGTQPNTKFRLKGKGVKSRSGQGDEFVEVQVEIPRKVSRRERELYEELKSGQSESPFERFKRAFK